MGIFNSDIKSIGKIIGDKDEKKFIVNLCMLMRVNCFYDIVLMIAEEHHKLKSSDIDEKEKLKIAQNIVRYYTYLQDEFDFYGDGHCEIYYKEAKKILEEANQQPEEI